MGGSGARNQHTRHPHVTSHVAPRHATHLAPVTATRVRNRARSRPGLATAFFPFSALMSALQFVRLFIAFIDHKVAYLYTRDARVCRMWCRVPQYSGEAYLLSINELSNNTD